MTREEAIDVLKHTIAYESDFAEAKRMAIKALSAPQTDLISRANAIEAVCDKCPISVKEKCEWKDNGHCSMKVALEALPSADAVSRKALNDVKFVAIKGDKVEEAYRSGWNSAIECIIENAPSAEAVQGWRTGKPKKQGEYIVTVKSMRGGMVELLYYGKPLMPNRKVRGMCWYRSDDEWGDVVYDDADILAWMPLPEPYKGSEEK